MEKNVMNLVDVSIGIVSPETITSNNGECTVPARIQCSFNEDIIPIFIEKNGALWREVERRFTEVIQEAGGVLLAGILAMSEDAFDEPN